VQHSHPLFKGNISVADGDVALEKGMGVFATRLYLAYSKLLKLEAVVVASALGDI